MRIAADTPRPGLSTTASAPTPSLRAAQQTRQVQACAQHSRHIESEPARSSQTHPHKEHRCAPTALVPGSPCAKSKAQADAQRCSTCCAARVAVNPHCHGTSAVRQLESHLHLKEGTSGQQMVCHTAGMREACDHKDIFRQRAHSCRTCIRRQSQIPTHLRCRRWWREWLAALLRSTPWPGCACRACARRPRPPPANQQRTRTMTSPQMTACLRPAQLFNGSAPRSTKPGSFWQQGRVTPCKGRLVERSDD